MFNWAIHITFISVFIMKIIYAYINIERNNDQMVKVL